MLARKRNVAYNGLTLFETPLLVPSFSSKGFPEMRKIISLMAEFITEAALISAYDIHYKKVRARELTFPAVLFLDSGGYEARVEHDLSEAYGSEYKPRKWKLPSYQEVLTSWQLPTPTVAVSFDSPHRHSSLRRQIDSAEHLFNEFPNFVPELLLKPERKGGFIEVEPVMRVSSSLKRFAVVAVTERELGSKLIIRMEKIARLRQILDSAGVAAPIHIFGSLDTLSTPLYFLSGAEIFDGLTWLRFGYHGGLTLYSQNYGTVQSKNGILKSGRELAHSMWKDNYYYLESLRDQMRYFAQDGDFKHFTSIGSQLARAAEQLYSRVGE